VKTPDLTRHHSFQMVLFYWYKILFGASIALALFLCHTTLKNSACRFRPKILKSIKNNNFFYDGFRLIYIFGKNTNYV
jgi:hypothetical protein